MSLPRASVCRTVLYQAAAGLQSLLYFDQSIATIGLPPTWHVQDDLGIWHTVNFVFGFFPTAILLNVFIWPPGRKPIAYDNGYPNDTGRSVIGDHLHVHPNALITPV